MYHAGMIVVEIEVDAVGIDIVDAESESYSSRLWGRTKASASENTGRRTWNDVSQPSEMKGG
jgi:hypothetical protein